MRVLCGLFFMFSKFYQLDVHNKTCVASANLIRWNIHKNWKGDWTFLDLNMVIGSACFVDFWIGYIGPPNCVHCWAVINIWRRSLISFKPVSLWCLFCDPQWTLYQSNIGVWSRKWATWDPSTLSTFKHHRSLGLAMHKNVYFSKLWKNQLDIEFQFEWSPLC